MAIRLAVVALVSHALGVLSLPFVEPRIAQGEPFILYAWGHGIPGLPLQYADGNAVFADYVTASKTDNMVPLSFSLLKAPPAASPQLATGYQVTAFPDPSAPVRNAATVSPPFSQADLFVPTSSSSSHVAGFLTPTTPIASLAETGNEAAAAAATIKTDGFVLSETVMRRIDAKGAVVGNAWCAFPIPGEEGVWRLEWNVDSVARPGGVPVNLRTLKFPAGVAPPSNPEGRCRSL